MVGEGYVPFRPFGEWATGITSSASYNDYVTNWTAAKAGASDAQRQAALAYVLRTAALETGAIEGLYTGSRGITQTVALQAAAWQASLRQLGDDAPGHFAAQLEAFESILDMATGERPLTTIAIRELHAVVCRNQPTHPVYVGADRVEHRPLRHGHYKDDPNRVIAADGTEHFYCPPLDVPAEMERLTLELATNGFVTSPPVVQTAYFHHAFTTIHPFADGNGRVARAAASAYLYRSAGIPLVIFSGQSLDYYAALLAADRGQSQAFVQFIEARALDALGIITQHLQSLRYAEVPERLRRLRGAHGGLPHGEIEAVAHRIIGETHSRALEYLTGRVDGIASVTPSPMAQTCSFATSHHSPPGETGFKIRVHCNPPIDVAVECTPMLGIANDVGSHDVFTIIDANRPDGPPLFVRLDQVYPSLNEAGTLNLDTWVATTFGRVLSDLADAIEQHHGAHGYCYTESRSP